MLKEVRKKCRSTYVRVADSRVERECSQQRMSENPCVLVAPLGICAHERINLSLTAQATDA